MGMGGEEDEDQGRLFMEATCAWLKLPSCVHLGVLMEGMHTSFLKKKCSICSIKIALLLGNSYKIAGSFINRCDSFS